MKYRLSGVLSTGNHQLVVSKSGAHADMAAIATVWRIVTRLQSAGSVTAIMR